eukprot:6203068-Pleurochrysis_carterae.AAC.1
MESASLVPGLNLRSSAGVARTPPPRSDPLPQTPRLFPTMYRDPPCPPPTWDQGERSHGSCVAVGTPEPYDGNTRVTPT